MRCWFILNNALQSVVLGVFIYFLSECAFDDIYLSVTANRFVTNSNLVTVGGGNFTQYL